MRILVSGATATLDKLSASKLGSKRLGHLYTPQMGNDMGSMLRTGLPWSCDNAAYSNWDHEKFWKMAIDAWGWMTQSPPDWVAAPDCVGNHAETLRLFQGWIDMWNEEIGYVPFPLAFVLQNGATISSIPWDYIVAVFVGGDDEFKLKDCRPLLEEATARGKLKHIGRVNSLKRLRYAMEVGADTVDGTSFSMFPDAKIPRALRFIEQFENSQLLFS